MPAACRVSDGEVGGCSVGAPCCGHGRSGTNASGSPNVFIEGLPAHRLGDTGPCNCPHGGTFSTTSGSPNVFVNGIPLSRIGDSTACMGCGIGGTHVSGSPTVTAN